MAQIRKASGAVILATLVTAGLVSCESQEQRQRIETLTKQVEQVQQENAQLKSQLGNLTKENQDLKVQLEAATKKAAPVRKK